LAGLYGLYLLYLGLPKLKKTPADKHVGYFVVSLLVIIVLNIVIGLLMNALLPLRPYADAGIDFRY
jgi:hypothetical protein